MKGLTIATLLAAAVLIAMFPAIGTVYSAAYPDDPARQHALSICTRDDPGFNRLLAIDRAACYQRLLNLPASKAGAPSTPAIHVDRRLVPV